MNAFLGFWKGLDWSYPLELLASAIPALLCIMIHEICHGAAAYALGDRTAASQGRLSLNPLRHIDWLGLAMLVVFRVGWAKPVSVDIRSFRRPKRDMAITALAGPASNFVLAALSMLLYGLTFDLLFSVGFGQVLLSMLQSMALLSLSLGLFNLIPFPPLDGAKILFSLLPDRIYARLLYLERYGMLLLLALVLLLRRAGVASPVSAAAQAIYRQLAGLAVWANSLTH